MCFAFMMVDKQEFASYTFQNARDIAQLSNNNVSNMDAPVQQEPVPGNTNLTLPHAASVASSSYDGDGGGNPKPTTKEAPTYPLGTRSVARPGLTLTENLNEDTSDDISDNNTSMSKASEEPKTEHEDVEMEAEEESDASDNDEEDDFDDEQTLVDEETGTEDAILDAMYRHYLLGYSFTDRFIAIRNDEELEEFYTEWGIPH